MLVGSATKSVIAGSMPRATGCCASQPTRSSGNARQCWKRSTPPSPKPLRRRFAPAPPRPAGRSRESPRLDYSGTRFPRAGASPRPSQGLPAGEAFADPVPMGDGRLAQLPAQLDDLAVAVGEEVHQSGARILELDLELIEPPQRRHELQLSRLQLRQYLLVGLRIVFAGARPLASVLGDPDLVFELGQVRSQLDDPADGFTHFGQPAI